MTKNKQNTATELQFPFIEVSDADAMFGFDNKGNYQNVLKSCPEEFFKTTYYSELFSKIFFSGMKVSELNFKSSNQVIRNKQLKYLRSIMISYEPKHEDKQAVCSWILSLIINKKKENHVK